MEEIEVLEGRACMHAIMSALQQLPAACHLTLHRLPPPAAAHVPAVLHAAASLTTLSLDRAAVSAATVFDLSRALAVNTTLRVLSMRCSALSADSLCEVVEMLEENQTLRELDASWSCEAAAARGGGVGVGKDAEGAASWAKLGALARNTGLEVLRLRGCALPDAAVAELAPAVRVNARLRVLDLSCNVWTWRSAGALGEMLAGAAALECVELERGHLSRWGVWTVLRACAARREPPVLDLRQVCPTLAPHCSHGVRSIAMLCRTYLVWAKAWSCQPPALGI